MNSTNGLPARFSAALDRLDGNLELLQQLALITTEDLPKALDQAQADVRSADCDAAAKSLHKLKGMLSTFESDGITLDLQEMIEIARKGDVEELQRLFSRHQQRVDELVSEIAKLADSSTYQSGQQR